jgi:cell division protein FtsI/penicillin-binding protein 2
MHNWRIKIKEILSGDFLAIFLILFFFSIFSLIILFRLYSLQIEKGEKFRDRVLSSSQRLQSNKIFDRGKIYFRDSDDLIPVAIQKNGFTLIVNNKDNLFLKNNNKEEVYKKLKKIIDIDKNRFLKTVSHSGDPYEEIKTKIEYPTYKKIKDLKIKGLSFVRES